MTTFEIQEIAKIKSCGALCSMCRKKVGIETDKYRVKYGIGVLHLHCFYDWLNKSLLLNSGKTKFLLKCKEELKEHMPEILAENIIKGGT